MYNSKQCYTFSERSNCMPSLTCKNLVSNACTQVNKYMVQCVTWEREQRDEDGLNAGNGHALIMKEDVKIAV